MKLVRKIIFYINLVLVVVTLLAYLSPFINPAGFWALSFLGLLIPVFLLFNLLFIFYWMITEWKRSWLSIACLLIGAHYINQTISFSGSDQVEKPTFTIASYNMNFGKYTIKEGSYKQDKQKVSDFTSFIVDEIDTDILCGQEVNDDNKNWIKKYYPYDHYSKVRGTVIYSRFPMINKGNLDFGTLTNSCIWADIVINGDTVRVYSAHLQSNMITSDAKKVMEEVEQNQEVDFMNVRKILGKYKRYVAKRSYQANMVRRHMDESPYPVILAADLNDPPVSYTHRILSKDHQDSFVSAGNGMGITYAGHIPLLRIDNVILSGDFEVLGHKVIRQRFSDHYPVRVEVKY